MSNNPHISPLWPGKLYRKIDVFLNGRYIHSTNAYTTCKAAILGAKYNLGEGDYKASFAN